MTLQQTSGAQNPRMTSTLQHEAGPFNRSFANTSLKMQHEGSSLETLDVSKLTT